MYSSKQTRLSNYHEKTLTFATLHFTIAFSVAYVLTGDILIGSLIAMIEPSVNTVAFTFMKKLGQVFPL